MTQDRAGSLAEEATKLVEALQGWLPAGGHPSPDPWAEATAGHGPAAAAPECTVCPLCRSMRFLRTVDPAVVDHVVDEVVDAAAAFVASVQALRRRDSST